MASIKESLKKLITNDKTNLISAINEVHSNANTHVAESMPHTFIDNGIKYRWGFRLLNGEPQIIYEEVK